MPRFLDKLFVWTFRIRTLGSRLRSQDSRAFRGSQSYWQQRYAAGDNSGAGSHGRLAIFKAEVINRFIQERQVASVIEFGCGDGRQLELSAYPRYLGYDVSETAIARCRMRFAADPTKEFRLIKDYAGETAEVAISLDVIYHLVEDEVFEKHMSTLFGAAERHVIIYSTNSDFNPWYTVAHVRNREFTRWVASRAPQWRLTATRPGYEAEFFFYERIQ